MGAFCLAYPDIVQTASAQLLPERGKKLQTPSAEFADLSVIVPHFPLPWSHYVCFLSVEKPEARKFYEEEALRGGWSVRTLQEWEQGEREPSGAGKSLIRIAQRHPKSARGRDEVNSEGDRLPGNQRPCWFSSQCSGMKSGARGSVVGSVVLLDKGSRSVENQSK
ncbi:MAG: hypothetical protein HY848_08790 [Betaproteobacteria bacterium]|nr:hypothetical protein [Betaproteobacteria bacterium]